MTLRFGDQAIARMAGIASFAQKGAMASISPERGRALHARPQILSKAGIVRFDGGPQPQDIRWVATIASKRLRTCIFLKSCVA